MSDRVIVIKKETERVIHPTPPPPQIVYRDRAGVSKPTEESPVLGFVILGILAAVVVALYVFGFRNLWVFAGALAAAFLAICFVLGSMDDK